MTIIDMVNEVFELSLLFKFTTKTMECREIIFYGAHFSHKICNTCTNIIWTLYYEYMIDKHNKSYFYHCFSRIVFRCMFSTLVRSQATIIRFLEVHVLFGSIKRILCSNRISYFKSCRSNQSTIHLSYLLFRLFFHIFLKQFNNWRQIRVLNI